MFIKSQNKYLLEQGVEIIHKIQVNGFDAYFVGGCVRDYILSLPIKDIDITTSATPEDLIKIFPNLIPIGIEHGTVLIREHNLSFEVTTYRGGTSHPAQMHQKETIFAESLEIDVSFRDFTINTLAMDVDMSILDYHNGLNDIKSQVIRAVGNPLERLQEDPLRVLRGIRFVSQFGFTIEENTNRAMIKRAHLLESVAVERILLECEKIFFGHHSKKAIETLVGNQIHHYLPVFKEEPALLLKALKHIKPLKSFAEVLTIMHLLAPHHSLSSWCNDWKSTNRDRKNAKKLVWACMHANKNGVTDPILIYSLEGKLDSFYRVYSVLYPYEELQIDTLNQIGQKLSIKNRKDLAITGSDIIQIYSEIQPGKWIEELLKKIELKVVMEELPNESMTLKEWIKCNPPETN